MPVVNVRKANVGSVELCKKQHLHYFLMAQGAEASFSLACEHREDIVKASDFPGHPKQNYDWMVKIGDLDAGDDNYAVALGYLVALKYTLRIEHHNQNHTLKELISDKDYEGKKNDDFDIEIVKIFECQEDEE